MKFRFVFLDVLSCKIHGSTSQKTNLNFKIKVRLKCGLIPQQDACFQIYLLYIVISSQVLFHNGSLLH
jgi:hypothetical protein